MLANIIYTRNCANFWYIFFFYCDTKFPGCELARTSLSVERLRETPGSPMSTHDSLQSRWVNLWSGADGLADGQRQRVYIHVYVHMYLSVHVYVGICMFMYTSTVYVHSFAPITCWTHPLGRFACLEAHQSRCPATAPYSLQGSRGLADTSLPPWIKVTELKMETRVGFFSLSLVHERHGLPWNGVDLKRVVFNFRSVLGIAVTRRMCPRRAGLLRHCRCLSRCSQDTRLTRVLTYFQETDSVMTSRN